MENLEALQKAWEGFAKKPFALLAFVGFGLFIGSIIFFLRREDKLNEKIEKADERALNCSQQSIILSGQVNEANGRANTYLNLYNTCIADKLKK